MTIEKFIINHQACLHENLNLSTGNLVKNAGKIQLFIEEFARPRLNVKDDMPWIDIWFLIRCKQKKLVNQRKAA